MNRSLLYDITEEDVKAYREHGLMCIPGAFDSDWVQYLREAVAVVPGGYVDRSFIWPFHETFRELAFNSPVGEIAATLMGSRTCGLQIDNIHVKHPRSDDYTPWHHDQPYYQVQGTQLCGMWIGLDEINRENGGLEWIRSSHKWEELFEPDSFTDRKFDVKTGRRPVPDIEGHRENYDIVHFNTNPGDCIVSQLTMLHAGGPNQTDRPRRAIVLAFHGDDARFKQIPPSRGGEDARYLALTDGQRFPPDHKLVPRIWPKRDKLDWPRPRDWKVNPGAVPQYNPSIAQLGARGAVLDSDADSR